MSDGGAALQQAVFGALTSPPITITGDGFSAAAIPVYDLVQQDAAYPHIEIATDTVQAWKYSAIPGGEEHTIELHVWSRYAGFAECRAIMAAVKNALDEQPLSLTGASLVDILFDSSDVLKDIDGLTVHGIVRFRAVLTVP